MDGDRGRDPGGWLVIRTVKSCVVFAFLLLAGPALAQIIDLDDDVTVSVPLGETLVPAPEGNKYLGFIFASGDTPEQVEAALRAAHGELEFTIEPGRNP